MPDCQNLSRLPDNMPYGNDSKVKLIDQFICSVEHRLSPTQHRILNELRTYIDLMEVSILPSNERVNGLCGEVSIHLLGVGVKGIIKLRITDGADKHPLISRGSVDFPIANTIQINYSKLSESQLHVLLTVLNMVNRYSTWVGLDFNANTSHIAVGIDSNGIDGYIEIELHQ